jgi:putative long chain acyl-CoA synthase
VQGQQERTGGSGERRVSRSAQEALVSDEKRTQRTLKRAQRGLKAVGRGAENALQLLRHGRLGAPYQADHEVVFREGFLRLRHYTGRASAQGSAGTALLIPPLMVTAEIYDISPELSSVTFLVESGLDVWGVDFGSPETEKGGMERTLDEHILGINRAVEEVAKRTQGDVHLIGYSQGGMFAYQVAAYRRCANIASVVTFGSPVDMRRNLPLRLNDTLAERVITAARDSIKGPLDELKGLPGALTSRGFKLLAPKQEMRHLISMLGLLHDKKAYAEAEPRRRFLGGEGFIAWPGPAFKSFVDQFVVNNRLRSGGMVIAGRATSLSDVTVPILYFVGERDEFARPEAVRAIRKAATSADTYEVLVPTGHFGLVVGSRAMSLAWPAVAEWIPWIDGNGDAPQILQEGESEEDVEEDTPDVSPDNAGTFAQRMYDLATDAVDDLWHRMGDFSVDVTDVVGAMRWQLPRLARLLSLEDDSRVSLSRLLSEQASAIPEETFFLWEGRAFTYRQADERVTQMACVLLEQGVQHGTRVGVLMSNHPDYLSVTAAVNRLGAVSVLLNAGARGRSLTQALDTGDVALLVVDTAHSETAASAAGTRRVVSVQPVDDAVAGVTDVSDTISAANTTLPAGIRANPGLGSELSVLLFTSGTTGMPKAARITHRRQVAAALWAAMACDLTPRSTVYCCLPLYHATGLLVAVGGALVGGSRLALAPRFSTSSFWPDVRRYGADVVFYVGELCRYLVVAPPHAEERNHPVRKFVGNGMRPEVWRRLLQRFGDLQVVEFYGSTEGNIVIGNVGGEKIGSIGQPLAGSGEIALVKYDVSRGDLVRDASGRGTLCDTGESGLLVARIEEEQPLARFDGYDDAAETDLKILRDLFEAGDAWFNSGDLMRQDEDGDFWFVDRLGDTFRWKGENVSTSQVADTLGEATFVAFAAVYGVALPDREGRAGMAAVQLVDGAPFDGKALYDVVVRHLSPAARPRFVRVVQALKMTDSLKITKRELQKEGADPGKIDDPLYWYDEAGATYTLLDMNSFVRLILRS